MHWSHSFSIFSAGCDIKNGVECGFLIKAYVALFFLHIYVFFPPFSMQLI